jgi:hypothetical protein
MPDLHREVGVRCHYKVNIGLKALIGFVASAAFVGLIALDLGLSTTSPISWFTGTVRGAMVYLIKG